MKIRCRAGVLGPVGLLAAVSAVAPAALAGQAPRVPAAPAALAGQAPRVPAAPAGRAASAAPVESVAVMPFANVSRNEPDDWLGRGIAETIAADLETREAFAVIALERVAAALDGAFADQEDAPPAAALGRALGARWVVAGGYQRIGDRLRITARLVDAPSGGVAATAKVDGAFADLFDLQDRIAGELTGAAGTRAATRAPPPVGAAGLPRFGGGAGEADFGPAARGRGDAGPAPGAGAGAGGFDFERAIRDGRFRRPGRFDAGPGAAVPAAGPGSGAVTGGIILPPRDPVNAGSREEAPRRAPEGIPVGAPGRLGEAGRAGGSSAGAPPPRGSAGLAAASLGILAGRPNVRAVRTAAPPQIDGNLDDAVWRQATRITEFVQQSPLEGEPATEDTEVYVAYDDTHLYFGLYAHYSQPSMMRANRVDRDQAFFGDDLISVYFDTFLDQQRAYVFSVNGYGVQNDSILEARGGGGSSSRRGSRGGGFSMGGRSSFTGVRWGDRSWDALYETGGVVVDDGWTAEMAIPFKSLRYPAVGDRPHRWGFQIARRIRGKDETVVWSPMSRDVSGLLPQMGVLDGLAGLSTSRNLEILPTATAIRVDSLDRTSGGLSDASQPEGGVNVKYGVTSNLTLDVTYNPDFSQIESDRPQIEVNQRFPLFYPEMRPFFLEGQEIFNMPGPVNFVHTRTIVDPRYGGKLTGKVGNTTMGVLYANDEAPGNLDDTGDFRYGKTADVLIGRVRYDLYAESHVGAIVTDREFLDGHSRLGGIDGNFRLNDATSIGFRAITSQNRDCADWGAEGCLADPTDTSGNMFDVGLRSNGRNLSYFLAGYTIDPAFDTAVGFVRRRDIRAGAGNVGYRWWPESWLINWGPSFGYTRNWNFADVLEDEMANVGVNFSFAKNIRLNASVNRDMERFGGIDFDKTYYSFGGNVSTIRAISFGGFFSYGDQVRYAAADSFLGTGARGSIFMSLRPFSRLQSQINVSTSNLVDPVADVEVFDVRIYRALTTFQFTDRLLLRNILEYNTFSRTVGANVLFTYRINSGTVFFIGYDDRYQQGDLIAGADGYTPAHLVNPVFYTTDLLRTNRAFFTKISYLFRY